MPSPDSNVIFTPFARRFGLAGYQDRRTQETAIQELRPEGEIAGFVLLQNTGLSCFHLVLLDRIARFRDISSTKTDPVSFHRTAGNEYDEYIANRRNHIPPADSARLTTETPRRSE